MCVLIFSLLGEKHVVEVLDVPLVEEIHLKIFTKKGMSVASDKTLLPKSTKPPTQWGSIAPLARETPRFNNSAQPTSVPSRQPAPHTAAQVDADLAQAEIIWKEQARLFAAPLAAVPVDANNLCPSTITFSSTRVSAAAADDVAAVAVSADAKAAEGANSRGPATNTSDGNDPEVHPSATSLDTKSADQL